MLALFYVLSQYHDMCQCLYHVYQFEVVFFFFKSIPIFYFYSIHYQFWLKLNNFVSLKLTSNLIFM